MVKRKSQYQRRLIHDDIPFPPSSALIADQKNNTKIPRKTSRHTFEPINLHPSPSDQNFWTVRKLTLVQNERNSKPLMKFAVYQFLKENLTTIHSRYLKEILLMEDLELMTTDQIILKLRQFGIPFDVRSFLNALQTTISAELIADQWFDTYPLIYDGLEEDFIWMAAIVLVKKLAPQWISYEELVEQINLGYAKDDANEPEKAILTWLAVWNRLKSLINPTIKNIHSFTPLISLYPEFPNWFLDLIEIYEDSLLEEKLLVTEMNEFTEQYLDRFPESDSPTLIKMRLLLAQTCFGLDQIERGERICQDLIQMYPSDETAYIILAEQYYFSPLNVEDGAEFPRDAKKAKSILEFALENNAQPNFRIKDYLQEIIEASSTDFELT